MSLFYVKLTLLLLSSELQEYKMLDDLKNLRDLFKGIMPTKAPKNGIGDEYAVVDAQKFAAARFTTKVFENGDSTQYTLENVTINNGDILTYAGRGSGDKKMYCFDTADGKIAHIHMTWQADGKPQTFGLEKHKIDRTPKQRIQGYGLQAD